ncbi:MAG: DNA translocase FtsK, partial [Lachnospiraceae bacterium]|nr:DNA translocase FtsK [Lachnospiraceae bacterium]
LLGGALAGFLTKALGSVGCVCLLLILMIICLILMTEKSVIRGFARRGREWYDNAREDMEYRLERNQELEKRRMERADEREKQSRIRQEEKEKRRQERRMDRKLSGVTMDTDLTPDDEETPAEDVNAGVAEALEAAEAVDSEPTRIYDMSGVRITGLPEENEELPYDTSVQIGDDGKSLLDAVINASSAVMDDADIREISSDENSGEDIAREADEKEQEIKPAAKRASRHRIEIREKEAVVDDAEDDMDMLSISEALEEAAEQYAGDDGGYEQADAQALTESQPVQSATEASRTVQNTAPAEKKPEVKPKLPYEKPPIKFLTQAKNSSRSNSERELRETAALLQTTLETFKVGATVTDISRGPAVTRYELQPEPGVKVSKIVSLTDDIKLALAATDIRIEAPIPGKSAVGIEVPNKENSMVSLRELIDSGEFAGSESKLSFAVGKDIAGKVVISDIAKMPHVLIAGSTGSGKSVCINTLIMSILYKAEPDEVKLILIDPKVVELSVYNGIPHLLLPVVTDPKKASAALQWGVNEMMDRYGKFEQLGVRDLKGYNKKIANMRENNGQSLEKLPQIVIVVDELADLMMVAPGEVEDSICRLAQLARAAGIHLVIATQRPSVDVITGLIKANMPSRIAFAVSSGVDSRTILDMVGAEKLLGKGDMLFYPQGYTKPVRVQGAFVSDKEVSDVADFLKERGKTGEESAENEILKQMESIDQATSEQSQDKAENDRDSYFADAGRFIIEKEKASIGMLQRVFKIGFNRAARIMDQLADYGVVGQEEGTKPRKVLMSITEFEQLLEDLNS